MLLKCKKGTILTFILIQPNPSYDMLLMSSQKSFMQKKREKVTEAFLRLAPPPPP